MKRSNIIRKLAGLVLICIFTISVTPKSSFHYIIANHNDECFDNHQFKGDQLTRQGYNCHFENLVVELPFIWQPQHQSTLINEYCTAHQPLLQVHFYSYDPVYTPLRGPPFLF